MPRPRISLVARLNSALGRDVGEFLQNWPNNQDDSHWEVPYRLVSHNGRKTTWARAIFQEICGEQLHITHMVRNRCGNPRCINPNPLHNEVVQREYKANWAPQPLPMKLANSLVDEDDEVTDVISLIHSREDLRDLQSVRQYTEGLFADEIIQKALAELEKGG